MTQGDLALTARAATRDALRPFGRLLTVGDHQAMSSGAGFMLSLEAAEPLSRRVTYLQCLPEAQRVVIAPAGVALWVLLVGRDGVPAAFQIAGGSGLLIDAGIWHAGPYPLAPGTLLELLETPGNADRLDRLPVSQHLGAAAVRVNLPEEDAGASFGWRLDAAGGLMLDAGLQGRLRLGALAYDAVEVGPSDPAARDELESVVQGLRAVWGKGREPTEIPGVRAAREIFRQVDIDPEQIRPPYESLLMAALEGQVSAARHVLADALEVACLRLGVACSLYDAERIQPPVVFRRGHGGEELASATGRKIRVAGHPVLADCEGPFGGLVGDGTRAAVTRSSRRIVVIVPFAPSFDPAAVEAVLDGLAAAIEGSGGGELRARRVFG